MDYADTVIFKYDRNKYMFGKNLKVLRMGSRDWKYTEMTEASVKLHLIAPSKA